MALPQTPSPPHPYPQALQLKLYQAFIFSIPILFSIILLLLFYLFYLKRRASSLSSSPPILPRSSSLHNPYVSSPCQVGLKGEIKDKLPIILFDEEFKTRESQCCVCLGEFEIEEELLQVPSCKHVFHVECIHHWLHSNSTCPLCRCLIIPIKFNNPAPPSVPEPHRQSNAISGQHLQNLSSEQRQEQDGGSSNITISLREQTMVAVEGSSSVSICSRDSGRLPDLSICRENDMGLNRESVVLHIQTS